MAFEHGLQTASFEAGASLSTSQYRIGRLSTAAATSGQVVRAGAAATDPIGIIQDNPSAAGRACSVATGGISKLEIKTNAAGESLQIGSPIQSGANGIGELHSTGGTAYVLCRSLEAVSTGVTGRVISVRITHEGPSSTA